MSEELKKFHVSYYRSDHWLFEVEAKSEKEAREILEKEEEEQGFSERILWDGAEPDDSGLRQPIDHLSGETIIDSEKDR